MLHLLSKGLCKGTARLFKGTTKVLQGQLHASFLVGVLEHHKDYRAYYKGSQGVEV